MRKTVATLGVISALLCSGTALAGRDQRVLKAIDFFDRAEFTRAKDLLVTLVDAPGLSEEDRLQSRIYLAASYYGLGDRTSAKAQFLALVRRYPRVELDPGLFLPEVVDLFHQARIEVAKETSATPVQPDQPIQSQPPVVSAPPPPVTPVTPPAPPSAPPGSATPAARGLTVATFLPFGAGQFARGDALAGHFFLWSEVGTLALAAGAKIHFQSLKRAPGGPWDFAHPAYVEDVAYATTVQNIFAASLIASGLIAVVGIGEAALRAGGPGPVAAKVSVGSGAGAISVSVEPSLAGIAVRF